MSDQIVIDRRFRGPPKTANGGYVCGLVAGLVGDTAEVTLRLPPPIDQPLDVRRHDDGRVALFDGESAIAEGLPTTVEIEIPEPVSFSDAEEAAKSFVWLKANVPYPTCFVCGEQRAAGDGLRIFAGSVAGRDIVAAPWTPDASLSDGNGAVRPEFVWSALDCPGAFAFIESADDLVLLGRLAARLIEPVQVSQRYVVIGWQLGSEGKKLYSGTALYSHTGTLHAYAKATWFKIETPTRSKTA
ncbi:MAG: hypothetical protein IIC88_02995 [Chloroflexi bacterium]|nr:hypothetical protein [Chloroflexota bacterium]